MKARLLQAIILGLLLIPSVFAAGPLDMLGRGIEVMFRPEVSLPHPGGAGEPIPIILAILVIAAIVGILYALIVYSGTRIKFLEGNNRIALLIALALGIGSVWASQIVEWIIIGISFFSNIMSIFIVVASIVLVIYVISASSSFAARKSMEAFRENSEFMDNFNNFLNERRKNKAKKIEKKLESVTELNAAKFKKTGIIPEKVKQALDAAKDSMRTVALPTEYTTEEIAKTIQEVLANLPQGKLNAFVKSQEGRELINEAEAKLRMLSAQLATGQKPRELEIIEERLKTIKKTKFWKSISNDKRKELEELYASAVQVQRNDILVQLQTLVKTVIARLSAVMAHSDNADSYIEALIKEAEGLMNRLKGSIEEGVRKFQEAVKYQEVLEDEFGNHKADMTKMDKKVKQLRKDYATWWGATPNSISLAKDYLNKISRDAQEVLREFPNNPNFKDQEMFINLVAEKLNFAVESYSSASEDLNKINREIKKVSKDKKFEKAEEVVKKAFEPLLEKEEKQRKTLLGTVAQAERQVRNTTDPKEAVSILVSLMNAIAGIDLDIKEEIKNATKEAEDKVKGKEKDKKQEEIEEAIQKIASTLETVQVREDVDRGPQSMNLVVQIGEMAIAVGIPQVEVKDVQRRARAMQTLEEEDTIRMLVRPTQASATLRFKKYFEKGTVSRKTTQFISKIQPEVGTHKEITDMITALVRSLS